jgi:hypothetical protein
MPASAKKIDLAVGVDAAFQMESQMKIQQSRRRTGARGGALFGESLFPGGIRAQAGGAADRGILALHLPVQNDLGGGIVADFFVGQDGNQAILQSAKTALYFAFGLRAGSHQMSDTQGGKGALKLGTWITIIGHGIMTKEAQSVGVDNHRQGVPDKEAAKMLEMIPGGVSGDKDRAKKFA